MISIEQEKVNQSRWPYDHKLHHLTHHALDSTSLVPPLPRPKRSQTTSWTAVVQMVHLTDGCLQITSNKPSSPSVNMPVPQRRQARAPPLSSTTIMTEGKSTIMYLPTLCKPDSRATQAGTRPRTSCNCRLVSQDILPAELDGVYGCYGQAG